MLLNRKKTNVAKIEPCNVRKELYHDQIEPYRSQKEPHRARKVAYCSQKELYHSCFGTDYP